MKAIVCLSIFTFMLYTNASASESLTIPEVFNWATKRSVPLSPKEEKKFVMFLLKQTNDYIKELKNVDFMDFKGRTDISAEKALEIKQEIDFVADGMKPMVIALEVQKKIKNTEIVYPWLLIARQISRNINMIDDIDNWGIIRSGWSTNFEIYLNCIFDLILLEKVHKMEKALGSHLNH